MKITQSIAWGGSDADETLLDVLAIVQNAAPSAKFRIVEAYPQHSGGWPLMEIEFDESDYGAMNGLFDLD